MGARVSILARDHAKLEAAKQQIQLATGIKVAVFSADVRDFDAVNKAMKEAGPIDVLVCNQGVFVPRELDNQSLDEVRFMIDVNLMGSFNLIKAALPMMKDRKSRGPASIAIMSSQAGQLKEEDTRKQMGKAGPGEEVKMLASTSDSDVGLSDEATETISSLADVD